MDFQKIQSGKEKTQILHLGFRLMWNKGPQGPNKTSYFKCVDKSCKATMATLGDLNGDLSLKWHHHHVHNHRADVTQNVVSSTLNDFREEMNKNPDRAAKQLFEEVINSAMDTAVSTPDKLNLAKKLPTFRQGIS